MHAKHAMIKLSCIDSPLCSKVVLSISGNFMKSQSFIIYTVFDLSNVTTNF